MDDVRAFDPAMVLRHHRIQGGVLPDAEDLTSTGTVLVPWLMMESTSPTEKARGTVIGGIGQNTVMPIVITRKNVNRT